ncbi:MAG: hypothetical protein ACOCXJ_05000 [Planctomycetota bacterium]
MSLDMPTTPAEAREVLKKVVCQCPHQDDQDPDCFLCSYKRMSVDERCAAIESLSDEEAVRFAQKHNHCFWQKLGGR